MPKPKLFAVVHTPYYRLQCAQQKRLSAKLKSNHQTDLPLFGEPATIPDTRDTGDKILSALLQDAQIIEVNPAADAAGVSPRSGQSLLGRVCFGVAGAGEVPLQPRHVESVLPFGDYDGGHTVADQIGQCPRF